MPESPFATETRSPTEGHGDDWGKGLFVMGHGMR